MAASITALVAGAKARPAAKTFLALVEELWNEGLVAPKAVVSVGAVRTIAPVASATKAGDGREVRWKGTELAGLLDAIRAAYDADDVAVWFEKLDLDAFEPAEEEEYEDVPDEGDDDGPDDASEGDEPAAPAGKAPAAKPAAKSADDDMGLGEFELVPPSMVLYSVRAPVELEENGGKKPKKFGPRAAWATLDGEDMSLLVDDLRDCWLLDVLEDGFGKVEVGKRTR